jgi:hypothetical protein
MIVNVDVERAVAHNDRRPLIFVSATAQETYRARDRCRGDCGRNHPCRYDLRGRPFRFLRGHAFLLDQRV